MSRILRRPMFRGGKVIDSRGTGITSGLMDGGRVGFFNGGDTVTGGEIVKANKPPGILGFTFDKPFLSIPKPKLRMGQVIDEDTGEVKTITPFSFLSTESGAEGLKKIGKSIDERNPRLDELGIDELAKPVTYGKSQEKAMKAADLEVGEGDINLTEEDKKGLNEFYKSLNIKEKVGDYKGGVPGEKKVEVPTIEPNAITGNLEQTTTIDPKELMRENAELFKELLGESNEKKLKDARIQDASDYLLKFFEGSQQEGATVGSSAANVAKFATSKDSRTERAKAAIDKQDQTAIALAINDYVAGKRSKEQLDMLIAKSDLALSNKKAALDYANKLTQGFTALPGFIADSKAIGYAGRVVDGLRKSGLSKFPMEKVTSKEMAEQFEFNPETDTGKIFIETDTKTTYTLVPDGAGGYKKNIIDRG